MTLDDIELPDDLLWVNEYQWQPVAQETERTLTGALLVQEQAKRYGQEIELAGEQSGWVSRSTVEALKMLEAEVGKVMTLTLPDTRTFQVIFDRSNGAAVEARQVLPYAYPDNDYLYSLTIRLLTVAP
ncbi:hypothetical protein GCM10023116_32770 [Kistimonas scapharcae]|uniref:Uncharacterized protein n=1 Tax=Kistimonas scapharcae TaxID=1036133 RepID=A0ABP8V4S3_9GAMM